MHDDARVGTTATDPPSTPGPPDPLDAIGPTSSNSCRHTGVAIDIACGLGSQSLWLARARAGCRSRSTCHRSRSTRSGQRRTPPASPTAIDARVIDLDDRPSRRADDRRRDRLSAVPPAVALPGRSPNGSLAGGIAIVTVLSEVGLPTHRARSMPHQVNSSRRSTEFDILDAHEGDGVATIVARRALTAVQPLARGARRATPRDGSMPGPWCP